ncbi:MAG TPA: hypothetical protein DCL35_03790 [Candidatus Omnitrophica bacterium]|nr:hypothetical protein [Candidatus Omnitrophota bacterium]
MASGNKCKVKSVKFKVNFNIIKYLILLFVFTLYTLHFTPFCATENVRVKEPNVAGTFYPDDKAELSALIRKYVRQAKGAPVGGKPVVLIAPHAGYIYSGPVAAYGYATIEGMSFDTVIILAASHYFSFKGASVYKEGSFRTPLGDLAIDTALASELLSLDSELLIFKPNYFEQEHSLEVELPFLQEVLKPGFKILPVLFGDLSYEGCLALAKYLAGVTEGRDVLVVASTDLSHYRPYGEALVYDKKTIDHIKNFDTRGLWDAVAGTGWNVCGIKPVVTGIEFAKIKNAKSLNVLKYANSGDTAGGKDRVVGYTSILISKEEGMFKREEKRRLLEIARRTIETQVREGKAPALEGECPALSARCGSFVTLRKKGELRGCIGRFTSDEPLYSVVSQMSIESCTHDYRFSPVTADELDDITIEISVLTEPELIEDWHRIRLGVDGVIIRKGYSSGVFLPQVAVETGWDLEMFLGQLCFQKAGLPSDCFKDPETKIYTFQAEIFSEDGLK